MSWIIMGIKENADTMGKELVNYHNAKLAGKDH